MVGVGACEEMGVEDGVGMGDCEGEGCSITVVGEGDIDEEGCPVTVNVAVVEMPVVTSLAGTLYRPLETLSGTVKDVVMVPVLVAVVVVTMAPLRKICTWPFDVKPDPVTDTVIPTEPLVGLNVMDEAAFAAGVIIGATANILRTSSASVAKLNSFSTREKRFSSDNFNTRYIACLFLRYKIFDGRALRVSIKKAEACLQP